MADIRLIPNYGTESKRYTKARTFSEVAADPPLPQYSLTDVLDVRGAAIIGFIPPVEIESMEQENIRLIIESSESATGTFRPIDYAHTENLVLNVKKDSVLKNIVVCPEIKGLAFIRMYLTDEAGTRLYIGSECDITVIGVDAGV
ncbi:MAG: hypothetical protein WC358_08305 [Ignavibacteria bacterium]|jgi:hypothetical protein